MSKLREPCLGAWSGGWRESGDTRAPDDFRLPEIEKRTWLFKPGPKKKAPPLGGNGLCWRSPPGRRENRLHRRRSRRISRAWLLCRSRCLAGVGHQTHIHAAILSATFPSLIALDRLIFSQPNQIDLVGGNAVLRSQ